MRKFLLILLLLAPAAAHPGDHAYLRIAVRGSEVVVELDLPAHALAAVDQNGDFLISAQELAARGSVVVNGLTLTSRGLAVRPRLELIPPPAWEKPPEDLMERGSRVVLMRLFYRWPWQVRDLALRLALFPEAAKPDCAVKVEGLGQVVRVKLRPDQPTAEFGSPPPGWAGCLALGALDPVAIVFMAGLMVVGSGGWFAAGYLAAGLTGLLVGRGFPGLAWVTLLVSLLATVDLAVRLPVPRQALALAAGCLLAWDRVANWQADPAGAALYGLGGSLALLLGAGLGRGARRWPPTAVGFCLLALLLRYRLSS